MVAYRYGLMVERGLRREDGRRINELPMHGHRTSRKPTLHCIHARWEKVFENDRLYPGNLGPWVRSTDNFASQA